MAKTHFRNLFHLYRSQVKKGVLIFLLFFVYSHSRASTGHQPFYDYERKIHFGFTIGTNFSSFKYELSDVFYETDSLLSISNRAFPGITLAAVSNLHFGEHFNVRFLPGLILSQRNLDYEFSNGTIVSKEVESVLVEFPITAKYKSLRHGNFRFYVIAGFKYGYDMASDAEATRDPFNPIVAITPHNYSYEFGFGFDIYFEYFKFSPELKVSRGLIDLLSKDDAIYSQAFDGLRSQFIFFNFHFE